MRLTCHTLSPFRIRRSGPDIWALLCAAANQQHAHSRSTLQRPRHFAGNGNTPEKFAARNQLLGKLDTGLDEFKQSSKLVEGLDRFGQQAFDLISSPRARQAFDVSLEDAKIAAPFGTTKFGQSCLLAGARLIAAGVKFTTVSFGGWDTHSGNFKKCKESLLPELDQGLAALFTTLDLKGLLASTTVFVIGEFGRTPKINPNAGRDHWPRAMFALLAGGGVRGGQVIGERRQRGRSRCGADHPRPGCRVVLSQLGDRLPQGISHQHWLASDDCPRRGVDPDIVWLTNNAGTMPDSLLRSRFESRVWHHHQRANRPPGQGPAPYPAC